MLLSLQDIFKEAGIAVTPKNKKEVVQAIHKLLEVEYKKCMPDCSEEIFSRLKYEARSSFSSSVPCFAPASSMMIYSATKPSRAKRIHRSVLSCLLVFSLICRVTPAFAQDPKRVRFAHSAFSVAFLNVFIAQDMGLFKKYGLEPELIQMAGPLPIAALVAGEIDYLTGYTTGLVAAAQGVPLKGVMVTLRKPPFYLVSEPSVQRADNLTGKRIGVDRIGSLQHLVARLLLKVKGVDPEKVIFTQTGSVSNTVTSLGQGAIAAAILSGPHNVIMAQKGFRQIGSADELPMHFPTGGLVVHETKLKNNPGQIKLAIRVMLDSMAFSQRERTRVVNYIRDKWKLDAKVAEAVYGQWISTLATDGKISVTDLQEYFDLAYSYRQIPVQVQVKTLTDYALLDQVLKESAGR